MCCPISIQRVPHTTSQPTSLPGGNGIAWKYAAFLLTQTEIAVFPFLPHYFVCGKLNRNHLCCFAHICVCVCVYVRPGRHLREPCCGKFMCCFSDFGLFLVCNARTSLQRTRVQACCVILLPSFMSSVLGQVDYRSLTGCCYGDVTLLMHIWC